MGANRWPVEACATVFAETDTFLETAQTVALSCDGAIIVHRDGTIEEEMVRISQLSPAEYRQNDDFPYAEWMGARHMSALETSTRQEVIAAITLSEEDGRVTVFTDGTFRDTPRVSGD
jgi:DNA integrity scanning protein DisA with diadenylate cyclase activity